MRIDKSVVLHGPRLLLRPVTMADVTERYCEWLNDPEVNRFLETRHQVQTLASIGEYVRQMQAAADSLFCAMVVRDGGRHIGNIKLGPINTRYRRGELSFFIGEKSCWGQGLATEAVGLLTEYGLSGLQLIKITAGCYSTNLGSRRVFEKLGYEIEGIFKKHYFSEGVWVDSLRFARFADVEGQQR